MHINHTTEKEYTGGNIDLLCISADEQGFTSNRWATYRQFQAAGLQVQKGQKSTELKRVVIKKVKGKDGEEEEKKLVKIFRVFNIQQTAPIEATQAA